MFSSLPMVTISRDLRKPTELIAANTFPVPNLFSAHSASIRTKACRPPCPDIAHQPAVLLLRHEHALAVSGAGVPVLGR